eukprot:gene10580-10739_t
MTANSKKVACASPDIEQGPPEAKERDAAYVPDTVPTSAATARSHDAAELYNAVGKIWTQVFGSHVHVGYYPDPARRTGKSWQEAQVDHIDEVLKLAGLKQATKMVDLGCGYGGTAVHMARRLGCQAVGVNISSFQVNAANELAAARGFSPEAVSFQVGDAMATTLPDASFDLVLSLESACYMPDSGRFIAEMARLAAPGGTLIIVDFCRKDGPINSKEQKQLAKTAKLIASQDDWRTAESYKKLLDVQWTKNIVGFWKVSVHSLLTRKSSPQLGFWAWQWEVIVRKALDSGLIEYHVIVAKKPLEVVIKAAYDAAGEPTSEHNRIKLLGALTAAGEDSRADTVPVPDQ